MAKGDLLRRLLRGWFDEEDLTIPPIAITDEPTPADIRRAHELIREHGWEHLLTSNK
jgi:ABC-type Zn uptake system ZnuABC Zn-binding protein ZnuA